MTDMQMLVKVNVIHVLTSLSILIK